MSLATALLTPILGDASPWTPRRLFQLGEAGGVYDPSDLTAEKVAWRRNLYLYSEPTSATGYTATNVTFTTNALFNFLPGGGACAELADATVSRSLRQSFTLTAGVTYTLSFYVTIAGGGLPNSGSGAYRDFTITRDNQDVTSYNTITYENLGGGVYRARHTWLHAGMSGNVTVQKYSGFNTNTAVRFTGLQLDVGSTATAYQRITDFTSDFLAAFPTHGLYQDAAGTTPVTALGQPVGLVIDQSRSDGRGIVNRLLWSQDLTQAAWTTVFGTTKNSATTVTIGTGATAEVRQQVNLVGGTASKVVTVSAVVSVASGTALFRLKNTHGGVVDNFTANLTATTTPTRFSFTVTNSASAGDGLQLIGFVNASDASSNGVQFTVTELQLEVGATASAYQRTSGALGGPGVHAIQPTNSSRPLLDGRVNLLERTEEFDNAYWTKTNGTITPNNGVAPDGTTTADLFTRTTSVAEVSRTLAKPGVAVRYVAAISAKAAAGSSLQIALSDNVTGDARAVFNLANGTFSGLSSGTWSNAAAEIVNEGNGWYRCLLTATSPANTQVLASYSHSAAGSTLLIWGADLRLAADAAYPYQRVAAATDYADVGVPRAFAFDGFDDSLYTASNMDLSGTDKVTVLAGVRKLSDAARGMVAEHGSAASFQLNAPSAALNTFTFGSVGTGTLRTADGVDAAPVVRVVTGLAGINTPVVTLRLNGVQASTNTNSQGTGNYGNEVLYIGRRTNTTLPFNGKAYQLIVRGALTDAATLAQAERYVGAKTGLYL